MPSVGANILLRVVSESRRQSRPVSSPIDEIITDEHARCRGIADNVQRVDGAVVATVVRILLKPLDTIFGKMIYVVAVCLFETSDKIGSFHQKPRILPVLIETQRFGHSHREHDMSFAIESSRSRSKHPIPDARVPPYEWFACG